MGRLLLRGLEEAGLLEVTERALAGAGCNEADIERLQKADFLLVAGLADLVRAKFHGDDVRIYTSATPRDADAVVVSAEQLGAPARTGAELLLALALVRLRTPAERSIAVSFDDVGLELAQSALVFGADVLVGELGGRRTLPLLDGLDARRAELTGLCTRAGRTVRFVDEPRAAAPAMEQRP